jgi:lipoprotein-anchoring transpeptidase ErfK/SrfK
MFKLLLAAAVAVALSLPLIANDAAAVTADDKQQVKVVKTKKVVTGENPRRKLLVAQVEGKKRKCGSFLDCLFGPSSRRTSRTDYGRFQFSGLSTRSSRKTVDWNETRYPVGSLIVRTPERALYYVSAEGEAIRYRVGVGREGFQWSGSGRISGKQEWPSWTPPQEMIEREAEKGHIIPDFMEGGPGNPLGARALYIGGTIFRVHGTNDERSIGGAVSSGCIRMMNADVVDLYNRVKVGSRIYVYQ